MTVWRFWRVPCPRFACPTEDREATVTVSAVMADHFVLIEVCSVDILVACLRMSTGFQGNSFRETHL